MEDDVARDVIRRLERIGVDYVITGSGALPRYGEPRQTADIDLVLALEPSEFHRIERAFATDYAVNPPIGEGILPGVLHVVQRFPSALAP